MSNLPETEKDESFLWQTSQVAADPLLIAHLTFSFKCTPLCSPPFVVHFNKAKPPKAGSSGINLRQQFLNPPSFLSAHHCSWKAVLRQPV